MNPNPDLVVEALRKAMRDLRDKAQPRTDIWHDIEYVLPHAEAIAEVWPKMIEVEADGGTTQREHFADLVQREPNVQELITAACRAVRERYGVEYLATALKNLEEEA